MSKSLNIGAVVHNVFLRPKKSIILALTLILILTYITRSLGSALIPDPKPVQEPIKKEEGFSLSKRRKRFSHSVYSEFEKGVAFSDGSLDEKCGAYFDVLSKKYPGNPGVNIVDVESLVNDEFNTFIYHKKKWIRNRRKEFRIANKERGVRRKMNGEILEQFNKEHEQALKKVSEHEEVVVDNFAHMRVFGKCFVEGKRKQEVVKQCPLFETKLYPWMSKQFATFKDWKGNAHKMEDVSNAGGRVPVPRSENPKETCFVQELISHSSGKGIVIPIIPTYPRDKQIRNIKKLIQILRGLKNQLPIQVTYMSDDLEDKEREELKKAARTDIAYLPGSFGDYYKKVNNEEPRRNFVSASDYPKQEIMFVNLENTKDGRRHPVVRKSSYFNSPDFIFTLSTIYNSFEEVVVLTEHAVPVNENFFNLLFNNKNYVKNGILLFKNPSLTSTRPRIFPPGFHEISDLVKNFMMPSKKDNSIFKISTKDRKLSASSRIFDEDFQKLLDPSVMVINKPKVLNGLLIAANMHMYKALSPRFPSAKDTLNPDFIWLGQEVAGTNPRVNFNRHFGVAAGVLTPPEIKPTDMITYSQEICSSSWGQLSDVDDNTLLYVTSHQMENWLDVEQFRTDIEKKYTTARKEPSSDENDPPSEETGDKTFFESTLKKNPQYMDTVINPVTLTKPMFEDYRESPKAWVERDDFADYKGHPLLCAYDIVGSHKTSKRGRIIYYNDKIKAWYRYILDLWLEDL